MIHSWHFNTKQVQIVIHKILECNASLYLHERAHAVEGGLKMCRCSRDLHLHLNPPYRCWWMCSRIIHSHISQMKSSQLYFKTFNYGCWVKSRLLHHNVSRYKESYSMHALLVLEQLTFFKLEMSIFWTEKPKHWSEKPIIKDVLNFEEVCAEPYPP